jgi:o-succinylbenzoate synthase
MKIKDIRIGKISVSLKKPFKTALRTVSSVENIIVEVLTDTGNIGYGSAAPTEVITGDTTGAIVGGIEYIKKNIVSLDIENFEEVMVKLNNCLVKNTSAKAAVDIALYDLYGQLYNAPVYKLLGGYIKSLVSDITISVNEPDEMVKDSLEAVEAGYKTLKIKVGKDSKKDLQRIKAVSKSVGRDIALRLDVNQGWKPKEAVSIIRKLEDLDINIELVEQPVKAHDFEGLKFVTDNVYLPILADESVFSPKDAMEIINMRAADLLNLKLMKTGGIYNALKIAAMAETAGIECMIGSMMESSIGATAAAHLAAAKAIITKVDLDVPILCKEDLVRGGADFDKYEITLSDKPGFGFEEVKGIEYLNVSF